MKKALSDLTLKVLLTPVNTGLVTGAFWPADLEAPPRFELGVKELQSSALPLGYGAVLERITRLELATSTLARWRSTRWAKSALIFLTPYTMLLERFWCLRTESNHRHEDFQSSALPTELQRQIVASFSRTTIGDPYQTRTDDLLRDRQAF